MPIRGVTDQQSRHPQFPTLGKLRKGGAKKKVWSKKYNKDIEGYGDDLEFFRFQSESNDVEGAFRDIYGNEPVYLQVYLPYPDPDRNFETWKEQWASGRVLKHRCDGVKITREYKGGKYIDYDRLGTPYERRPDCTGGCKEVGRLTLILPDLWKQGFLGYVTMETHSLHDLINIMNSLQEAYDKRTEAGLDLRAMKFTLGRVKKTISTPLDGKRVETQKNLVQIRPSVDWARLQIETSQQAERLALQGISGDSVHQDTIISDPVEVGHEEVSLIKEGEARAILVGQGDEACQRIRDMTEDSTILNALTAWEKGKHGWEMTKLDQMVNKLLAKEQDLLNPKPVETPQSENIAVECEHVETTPSFDEMMKMIRNQGDAVQITKAEKSLNGAEVDDSELARIYREVTA